MANPVVALGHCGTCGSPVARIRGRLHDLDSEYQHFCGSRGAREQQLPGFAVDTRECGHCGELFDVSHTGARLRHGHPTDPHECRSPVEAPERALAARKPLGRSSAPKQSTTRPPESGAQRGRKSRPKARVLE